MAPKPEKEALLTLENSSEVFRGYPRRLAPALRGRGVGSCLRFSLATVRVRRKDYLPLPAPEPLLLEPLVPRASRLRGHPAPPPILWAPAIARRGRPWPRSLPR